mgnify:CR=1 FL=1
MVFSGVMKEIKKFCKDDDTCIFIILVLIGFLLCMFFNRDEGFLNYSFLDDPKNQGHSEDLHQYGPADGNDKFKGIGQAPSGMDSRGEEKLVEGPVEKPVGMIPQDPGPPKNGSVIDKQIGIAKQGQQYQMDILPSQGRLNKIDSSLDRGPVGVELGYQSFMPFAQFGGPPSDMGPDKPMGPPEVPQMKQMQPQATETSGEDKQGSVGSSSKQIELVLFYAPWCGHSKNMLGDYEKVTSDLNGTQMNGVTVTIKKIDMDTDAGKEEAKKYNVEIKGFPTLYTFVEVDGKMVGQPFSSRDQEGITSELQKRTQALN